MAILASAFLVGARCLSGIIRAAGKRVTKSATPPHEAPAECAAAAMYDVSPGLQINPGRDPRFLASVRRSWSLVQFAREARKPVFQLTPADDAIGGHASTVQIA